MARDELEEDGIYHVYNRGTDKRDIFLDDQDYFRAIHYLYACNDTAPLEKITDPTSGDPISEYKREPIVDIIAYALMPNHFHFQLHEKSERGISKFMQKFGIGYTMYFNNKYKRTGVLFQGKHKRKVVDNEEYIPILARYIHLNPLELFDRNWKLNGVNSKSDSKDFLLQYRWSSYPDYNDRKNFPSILSLENTEDFIGDVGEFRDFMKEFTAERFDEIPHLMFD